jgi:hypothetical protein
MIYCRYLAPFASISQLFRDRLSKVGFILRPNVIFSSLLVPNLLKLRLSFSKGTFFAGVRA